MLGAALDLDEALTGHVAAIDLQDADQVRLAQLALFADLSDIFTDTKVLLNFLFHINTPSGLNLVHLGLFYSLGMLQWDQNGST